MLGKSRRRPVRRDRARDPAPGRPDRRRCTSTSGRCSSPPSSPSGRRVDYLLRVLPRSLRADAREPRLRHRRQRARRRRARRRGCVERGDEVVALARSDDGGGEARGARRARSCAATCSTRTRSPRAWTAATLAYHVAGVNTMCPTDPAAMLPRQRATAPRPRCAPPRGPACARVVLHVVGGVARRGARARSAARTRRTAAGTCRSTSAPSTRASAPSLAAARETGIEVVAVNPSSVQGPGRAGGTGRILIAYLNGRLKVVRRHATSASSTSTTASRATCWPPSAGSRASATCSAAMTLTSTEALELVAEVAGVAARAAAAAAPGGDGRRGASVEGGVPPRAPHAAGVPRDGPHAAARPPLRRLARRRASSACATPTRARRSGARSSGRGRPDSSRISSRASPVAVEDLGQAIEHLLLALGDELGR